MKKIYLALSVLFTTLISHAQFNNQVGCHAEQVTLQDAVNQGFTQQSLKQSFIDLVQQSRHYDFTSERAAATIPIIFHVVYNPNNPAENVSTTDIMNVFNDINEDFTLTNANQSQARTGFGFTPANPDIDFCLATKDPNGNPLATPGIVRVPTTEDYYDHDGGEENKMKAASTGGSEIWDRTRYLNVWICDISNGASSGTAGYAYRPTSSYLPNASIDGIVIDYNLGVNNENVLTHEIGHYLGLKHTWGDGGCSGANDDGFADTPNTDGPSFNYPGSCSGSQQTCGATEVQYENYMDYSNCTVMYTTEQANHMNFILSNMRASLLSSNGCDAVAGPPACDFTADVTTIPEGGAVNFTDLSSNMNATNAPLSWSWDFGGGAPASTLENPTITFNTAGTYTVTLTVTNTNGTDTETKTNYINVLAPASGIGCDTIRNWDWNGPLYNTYSGGGEYITGNSIVSGENVLYYAEQYTPTAATEVRRLAIYSPRVNDGGGAITFFVCQDDPNGGAYNEPTADIPDLGNILAQETYALADLNDGGYNEIDFSTPASVSSDFWVGYTISYANVTDTFATLSQLTGTPVSTPIDNKTYMYIGGGVSTWAAISEVWTSGGNPIGSKFAIDVLTSNGPAPTASLTISDDEVCEGTNVTFNGSGSTNTTDYFWYLFDGTSALLTNGGAAATTQNLSPDDRYYYLMYADGSCQSDVILDSVEVYPQISITTTGTDATCNQPNGSVQVTNTTGGSPDYLYSITGSSYGTGTSFTNLSAGTYTVYATDGTAGGCGDTTTVTINDTPTTGITVVQGNQTGCSGDSFTLEVSGGTNYSWSTGATGTNTITVSPTGTTQYTVEATDGGGCDVIEYIDIVINQTPGVDAGTNQSVCSGDNVTLTASNPDGASISWDNGVSDGVAFTATATDTYTVTADLLGCTNTDQVTVTVNSLPPFSVNGTDPLTCGASDGSITLSSLSPNSNYDISYTDGGVPVGPVSVTSNASGEYTITGLDAGGYANFMIDLQGGCSGTSASSISLSDPSAPTVGAGTDQTVCSGTSVTLTASNPDGASISWDNSVSDGVSFTPGSTNTYTVTANLAGCSSTDQVTVTVNQTPGIDPITNQTSCDTYTLPAITGTNLTGSEAYYTASGGNGLTFNAGDNITSTTTLFIYDETSTTPVCSNETSFDITIVAAPTVSAGTNQMVCDGSNVTLTANNPDGATLSWDNGVSDGVPFTPSVGTQVYTVTASLSGCTSDDQVSVTVNPLPTVSIDPVNSMCPEDAPITVTGNPAGGTFSGTGITGTSFDPGVAGSGTHTITYDYTDGNGCSNSTTENVIVNATPSINGTVTHAASGSDGSIDITVTGGNAPYTFDWGAEGNSEDLTDLSPGTYTVTVTTSDGCSSDQTFTIEDASGIEDSKFRDLSIYPNPSTGQFNIVFEGTYRVEVHNAIGQKIVSVQKQNNASINLQNVERGVYFMTIIKEQDRRTFKIVKQ